MVRFIGTFLFALLFSPCLQAQKNLRINEEFGKSLQMLNAEVLLPLDGDYRAFIPDNNFTQNCPWALRSRKERLEIRYLTSPFTTQKRAQKYPSIAAHRLAMHVCSNEEDAIITARDLSKHEQEVLYNADWGRVYIFPPKTDFSSFAFCKMIALYKEGKGMAYIFNLFDNPSPNIDSRLYSFRFIEANY
ncbi:MAG: hypothetical protein AAF705_09735 [Bacteroidota bacterium]